VTTAPSGGPLFDARGCLTPAGLAALRSATPGRAPKEVAAHLAGCQRCQQRLFDGLRGPGAAAPARAGSSGARLVWMLVLVVFGLLALVSGLLVTRWLAAH
jgi:hypothetical protein